MTTGEYRDKHGPLSFYSAASRKHLSNVRRAKAAKKAPRPAYVPRSAEDVIVDLRRLAKGRTHLTVKELKRRDPVLARQAVRAFGDGEKAFAAANVAHRRLRKLWIGDQFAEAVLSRAKSGKPMSYKAVLREEPELANAALGRYGSWGKALIALGLPWHELAERKPRTKYETGRALIKLAGKRKVIDLNTFNGLRNWVRPATLRRYGSLEEAARQLGLQVRREKQRWTDEAVLQDVRARMARGESVSSTRMRKVAPKTYAAGCRRFRLWSRVLALCRQP